MASPTPAYFLAILLGLSSCTKENPSDGSSDPSIAGSPDGFIRLPELEDLNPDPNVVEVSLTTAMTPIEIVEGVPNLHATYNASLPGPLIRAKRGDTLVVNLQNNLPEGTTIHWHGMRVPNGMDGVPGVTQEVVEAGASFRYEFPLLDASVYWYHPHFQTMKQVGSGLYGAVLVEDPDEEQGLGLETVMALSDISVFEDGSIQEHGNSAEIRSDGREGATLLLNGQRDQRMRIVSGQRLRWRVLNMARSRYMELRLKGHEFLRIGSDGGRLEFPVREATTRIVPGERVDLIVEPTGAPGTHLDLVTLPVDRGFNASTAIGPEVLLRLEFIEGAPKDQAALPPLDRALPSFPTEGAEELEVALTMGSRDGELVMGINNIPWTESEPLQSTLGVPQIWNVINSTAYSHPFHMHGFYFQVLNEDGTFESPLRYKDTIDIPPQGNLRLVPRFDIDRPGMWMFHCHILDHAESGMMGVLNLSDGSDVPDQPDQPDNPDTPQNPTPGEPGERQIFLQELLASESYKNAPWVAETSEARPLSEITSPHGDVRVYSNDVLLASLEQGNGFIINDLGEREISLESTPHIPGSLAVKEFYEGDQMIGKAAILKLEGEARNSAYLCEGPMERCGVLDTPPIYEENSKLSCGACHGGSIYTVEFPAP